MTKRRRFTAEFKARVALAALRGDKTIQEIAAKYEVHPNQVSTWKRRAIDGLGEVFAGGEERRRADTSDRVRRSGASAPSSPRSRPSPRNRPTSG